MMNLSTLFRFVGDMRKNEKTTYDLDLEERPTWNHTKKKNLQKEVSDQTEVMYNWYRVPFANKRNNLRNYIGVIVQENVPIIATD